MHSRTLDGVRVIGSGVVHETSNMTDVRRCHMVLVVETPDSG